MVFIKYMFQSEDQYENSKSSTVVENSYKTSQESIKPVNSVKNVMIYFFLNLILMTMFVTFQKISSWQQKSEDNDKNISFRKSSLTLMKTMASFDRKRSLKSNRSEDSDDDDDDNRDNEGRIRIHSGQEVRLLNTQQDYMNFLKSVMILK